MNMRNLVLCLHDIEAIKFGSFTLKSGINSPFYIDLRLIASYPKLLKEVAEEMWKLIEGIEFELLLGVPLGALPIAAAISLLHEVPMIYRRKEVKGHGLKREIEGVYSAGQRCVVVEDLITSGSSILETVEPMRREGLIARDALLLIDREQGGRENLQEEGIDLRAVLTMGEILSILEDSGRIDRATEGRVKNFIEQNKRVKVPL